MKTAKKAEEKFPRKGFQYNDRFRLTVKEFGRIVVIDLNRGKAVCSDDGKTVTIEYEDDENRKASTKPKPKKSSSNK
jgi:hypothetical protein